MKKRILSILLTLCMVLTMMPATVFAADGEVAARASETGGLYEHHEACGANSAGASDTMMPKTRSGAVRPAATQYTYTLHYDANGGSGAPPSQSVISSEFHVWVPISDKIPTRDGYTFMGWANSRTGKPIYGGNGGYTECLVVHGYDMSTTIYAIWEVHNHSWGEWTSNGNGTHTRTCIADSSHTETGNCSGGTATVNGETVSGKFTLDKDQKIYGHSLTASTLLQAGQLQLKIIFTPDNLKRYNKAKCTVDVNVVPRTFKETRAGHITNEKFGTPFEELNLSDSFSFYAVGDEKDPEGTGMDFGMNVVTSWDSSTYDPNSFEEQTIYGEVNRAELEKYFTIPENADLRAVRKVQLQPDPTETEITQLPVFRWKNGDFTLPDNTIFTWRKLQVGTYNDEVGTLVGGVAKVKGTDTVAPGTFSFKNAPPFYLQTPGEHDVTVVFTPDDLRLHKPTEITIKINAIKNTIRNIDEPDPITDKPFGTPFAELGLPENVCINAVDGAWRWVDVAWDESSYDAESVDWQTITGTPVLSNDDGDIFQQPEPAVTAAIRVKLIDNRPPMPPTIVAESLPDGMEGEAYSSRLTAKGTAPITWSIVSGVLPEGLSLNEDTGEISGTPAGEGTEVFTVMAVNALGEDIKEFSITIAKAPETEYAVIVRDDGHGTGSADPASATAGTEITLTAAPNAGYHFKEWQVMSGDVTVRDDKFTMPSDNVEIKAIFEEDAPPTPTEYTVTFDGNDGTPSVDSMTTTKQKLTSLPDASRSKHSFNGWYTEKSGGTKITTDTVFSANTTVYAHWTHTGDNNPPVNYYTLRFETGGGSAIPGVQETYNTYIDLTKYVPTRHGYTFVGWYSERSLVNKVSDIYLTGDRTVYAGWRAVTIPQTGDSGQMNLWSTALCASFAGCVALIVWKIRRREKKSL